jgi:bifunctional DNA-binding transcriptional regulator/antitoxin component of YhaV-PrlF toxin-antitoxin module
LREVETAMSHVKTLPPESVENLGSEIREHLALKSDDSLILIEGEDFVLVKRAGASPRERFREISAETRSRFERLGLEPDEVERAIRWARESS